VFLDPDVAAAFGDSTSVNQALRLLLKLAKERRPALLRCVAGSAAYPRVRQT